MKKEITYAGIGSRETPNDILARMQIAARACAKLGFVLRSGGARGTDTAFFKGHLEVHDANLQVFVPKNGFNGFRVDQKYVFGPPTKDARAVAKKYHPNWPVLGDLGRNFMARNAYQVLGWDLKSPSSFILCWTPNGKVVGGTGQALRMAHDMDIPILNFAVDSEDYISDFILSKAGEL